MTKYEAIFVHSAGTIGSEPTVHGAERAKVAIADYFNKNVDRIVCLGEPQYVYERFLKKNGIPESRITYLPGKSSFQQVFNARNFLAREGIKTGTYAVSSQGWHLRPRLFYLYASTIPLEVDFRIANDPRNRNVIEKEKEREMRLFWIDKKRMILPETIGRWSGIDYSFSFFDEILRSTEIHWKG